jgi:glyoxylase-like metal-dependent hydrolase (beta-lactamase superfamily II)
MAASRAATRQEQEPATTDVTEVAPGVLRSQLPIRMPGLGHVNMYMLEDERGMAVVDPGVPGPSSWRAVTDRLRRAGCAPRHVHTVVVTHSHPDHFGGAGMLRDRYGARVVTHTSFRTWFDTTEDEADDVRPPWRRELPWRDGRAMQPPFSRRLKFRLLRTAFRRWLRTPRPTQRLEDSEVISLAGRDWVALHTPGHTPYHLCLYDPAEGIVLSGDHVLPTITPHISGLVAGDDPLSEFFASLTKVAGLDGVATVLPAHGHPFSDLAGRAAEIRVHHEDRLTTLRQASAELGPSTVEELSHHLFRPRVWGPMAESETYAHLEHLRVTGEASSHREDGTLLYEINARSATG